MNVSDNISSILANSLYASEISVSGTSSSPTPITGMFKKTGILKDSPIYVFRAGLKKIDLCYVAEREEDIILSFRGTLSHSILDWLNDANAIPITVQNIPGQLHKGFYDSVNRLRNVDSSLGGKLDEIILQKMQETNKPLTITGYSKGAALAPIAAAVLKEIVGIGKDKIRVFIFEPPRPGDEHFAKYFNDKFPSTIRYEYKNDIVPHLPPEKGFVKVIKQIALEKITEPRIKEIVKAIMAYAKIDEWNYKAVGKNLFYVDSKNHIREYHEEYLEQALLGIRVAALIKLLKDHGPEKAIELMLECHLPCCCIPNHPRHPSTKPGLYKLISKECCPDDTNDCK